MHPSIPFLLKLQEMDKKIIERRKLLSKIPVEIEKIQKQFKIEEEKVAQNKKELLQVDLSIKEMEAEIAGLKSKINQYKIQQLSTRKNEEYQALSHQIDHATQKISDLEDKVLDLLEKKERISKTYKEADIQFHHLALEVKKKTEALSTQKENFEKSLSQLLEERKAYINHLEPHTLQIYQRIAASKPGTAIMPVIDETCGGCHMRMTKQAYLKVKASDALVFCEYCGRILFFSE
ncbi:DNA-binding protein [Candidatus Methylacidiphilum fumarolicum]|uniref:Zn-ribbon protein, possibly nucleic acid-binding n=3 Tax=Candidatus Methylacidiphilum fumarolicum TaxID=591154 RepID=I0JWB6_METFB|nr:C4-type zinc ribbon domain-containing protein [Candidatus Methylacidiphilum fumarolicum]MBW6415844.1 DNA-binding protein [Candidatus Methylacidiphilum fumarolicum]TFE66266.1 DNA-binding protein [Candidatus Methylacidiphilum fumarolicum]TFE72315.1 DNA-binding protein [Candidatus Methylacidiphilum fumarolicum]TFE73490.1 DNA-binding protein [Candidatus Methylacidiphilum fumarolicum]TFE77716.1 DNA-binding protein [Candidatus Methylacidiphilum fumarolicum]